MTKPTIKAVAQLYEAARKVGKEKATAATVTRLEISLAKAFRAQAAIFARLFERKAGQWPVQESMKLRESIPEELGPLFDDVLDKTLQLLLVPIDAAHATALELGALALIAEMSLGVSFDLKNPRAVDWLKANGAALVKRIDETTRNDIRYIVQYGADNGWSYTKTAAAIQAQYKDYYTGDSWWNFDAARAQAHIDSRAHLIAVCEAGQAYEAGNYVVIQDLQEAGIDVEKSWSTMNDIRVSEGCQANQDEGWIPADQPHASGDMHPLRHPACRCDELYRVVKRGKNE